MRASDFETLPIAEVEAFYKRFRDADAATAREAVGDRKAARKHARTMARAACDAINARGCRARGDAAAAATFESQYRHAVSQLPEDLR